MWKSHGGTRTVSFISVNTNMLFSSITQTRIKKYMLLDYSNHFQEILHYYIVYQFAYSQLILISFSNYYIHKLYIKPSLSYIIYPSFWVQCINIGISYMYLLLLLLWDNHSDNLCYAENYCCKHWWITVIFWCKLHSVAVQNFALNFLRVHHTRGRMSRNAF